MMRNSIYDVARQAGVSISTVSRVLNGTAAVNPEKEAAVRKAIAQLGYEPSSMARGLAKNRAGLIGLYMPFFQQDTLLNNYYSEMLRGVMMGTQSSEYRIVLLNEGHRAQQPQYKKFISQGLIDGLLLSITDPHGNYYQEFLELLDSGFPTAYIGKRYVDKGLNAYAQYTKHVYDALKVFYTSGHRRIGTVIWGMRGAGISRFEKVVQQFRHEMAPEFEVETIGIDISEGLDSISNELAAAIDRLLEKGCTGLYFSDAMGINQIRSHLAARGLSVPGDVSIIVVEHYLAPVPQFSYPISSFYVPVFDMAQALTGMLLETLGGHQPAQAEKLFEPIYLDRGSVRTL